MNDKEKARAKRERDKVFHDMKHSTPRIVFDTRADKGAAVARKQRIAIALNKLRKKGITP